jgi:tetratricopeptide (TPR) repeat protein
VGSSQGFVDTRLDTWKSVASYLGRSSRTVQRWHAEYGLPVHHLGGDASSVYAYTDELDLWLRRRDGSISESQARLTRRATPLPLISVLDKKNEEADTNREPAFASHRESDELIAGAQKLWSSVSASNLSTIARMYRKAADLDPYDPRAHAGLAQALIAHAVLGNLHPSPAFRTAEVALQRALELDPDLFEALCVSAMLRTFVQRDWSGAAECIDAALAVRPNASQVLVGHAFLLIAQSRLTEAREELRKALMEYPLNTSVAEFLCWVEYLAGNFESAMSLIADARDTGHSGAVLDVVEAMSGVFLGGAESQIQRLEAMVAGSPRNQAAMGVLGYAYGVTRRKDEAGRILDSMTRTGLTGANDFAYPIALTFLGIGEHREAARWLEQSYKDGSLWSLGFGSDPILAELRKDPEFGEFVGEKNYPVNRARLDAKITARLMAAVQFSA